MLTRGTLIYIAQRLALILFTLIVVSFLVFITVHSLPGSAFESEKVHGKALQLVLHEYGLDRPILVQYWSFFTNAIHGNLGVLISDSRIAHHARRHARAQCQRRARRDRASDHDRPGNDLWGSRRNPPEQLG